METTEIVLCPTKTGRGYKIVVDGVWFYTSKRELHEVVNRGRKCVFRTIDEPKQ